MGCKRTVGLLLGDGGYGRLKWFPTIAGNPGAVPAPVRGFLERWRRGNSGQHKEQGGICWYLKIEVHETVNQDASTTDQRAQGDGTIDVQSPVVNLLPGCAI